MFCPSCGERNSRDQRFCRRCGMNLESAARALLEQFPGGERPDLVQREKALERFGQIAFGGFGIVLVIAVVGIIYTIFSKMVLSGEQPWAGVLLSAFIVFAVLSLAYVVFAEDLKEKKKKTPAQPKELRTPAVTGRLLEEKEFEPIPTITEETTNLLPQDKTRRF